MKELLGGKGANLHEMTSLGLPVPPGFTISTEVCTYFYDHERNYPSGLDLQVKRAVAQMERVMKRKFGSAKSPLLVSVRSGARVSMPGMMDTILNLGLNDETVEGLAKESGERFAFDSYRRFVAMYSDVVLDVSMHEFDNALEEKKQSLGIEEDTDLSANDLRDLVKTFKRIVRVSGKQFPEDPWEQLWGAVGAVFGSWDNPRAITYRKLNGYSDRWGTAVNVQAMVFGNMGEDCATGVAFTRDPSTGAKKFFGEYLVNAQGEDVVAGIRTPHPINDESKNDSNRMFSTLKERMPKAYRQLESVYKRLEKHYRDMQDIEFTIERNQLFMLQTRSGKRTAKAALKIAVDMVKERLISKPEAISRIQPAQLDQLLHPGLDPKAPKEIIAKGLPASPGAASGQIVFDPDTAQKWKEELGRRVILVRVETSPEDIHGMTSSEGILTARGGMTSHAAVVARGMGKCCIAGCGVLKISYERKELSVGERILREGDWLTLDGSTGEVILGEVPTIRSSLNADFVQLMSWVDQIRQMKVRTNADTPHDARVAREFGAEGIGLCRTEHMFFESDRIDTVREMILADSEAGRLKALERILPMQRSDFIGIFEAMAGLPVTIRLLDPPLHEFIPQTKVELQALSERIGIPFDRIERRAEGLHEFNPMLGHRGVRLAVSYPEIARTQTRAIIEAACDVLKKTGKAPQPEIMIPLVAYDTEFKFVERLVREEAESVLEERKVKGKRPAVKYLVGTMIELPRAALTADRIAERAEFFSFGTNDLTQTGLGLSRDDSGAFLKDYYDRKIIESDPFATLDQEGIGELVRIGFEKGRKTRSDLKVGVCGEHGGDPESVRFVHQIGLDYVSCSPYRVPIARLAAAQAAIAHPRRVLKVAKK